MHQFLQLKLEGGSGIPNLVGEIRDAIPQWVLVLFLHTDQCVEHLNALLLSGVQA